MSLEESGAGVCWADLADDAKLQCNACNDGEACVYRTADQLVCVPIEICEALWDLGATTVCRYADKSAYDHHPLPNPSGPCPGGNPDKPRICGGSCPPCTYQVEVPRRCTGRSPAHPYGVCAEEDHFGGTGDQTSVQSCSMTAEGKLIQTCDGAAYDAYCAVFDVPAPDVTAARRWGVCLHADTCKLAASVLPGGLHCFDDQGNQVAP